MIQKPEWMKEECFDKLMELMTFITNQSDANTIFEALKENLMLVDNCNDKSIKMHITDAIGNSHKLISHLMWMKAPLEFQYIDEGNIKAIEHY